MPACSRRGRLPPQFPLMFSGLSQPPSGEPLEDCAAAGLKGSAAKPNDPSQKAMALTAAAGMLNCLPTSQSATYACLPPPRGSAVSWPELTQLTNNKIGLFFKNPVPAFLDDATL